MSERDPDPVLVVGDLMLDEACFGRRDRVCPDAAAPVFRVQRRESTLGGQPGWPECWSTWACPSISWG